MPLFKGTALAMAIEHLGVSMEYFFEKEGSVVHETAPTYRTRLTAAEIEQVKRRIDAAVAEGFEKLQKRIG